MVIPDAISEDPKYPGLFCDLVLASMIGGDVLHATVFWVGVHRMVGNPSVSGSKVLKH